METVYIESSVLSYLVVIWNVDYLLTWNCKHIANAHAVPQLRKFTESLGYEFPHICTPEDL